MRFGRRTLYFLSISFTLPHEIAHYAVARTVTDDAQIAAEVTDKRAVSGWSPIKSPTVRFITHLAPTLSALLLLLVLLLSSFETDGLLPLIALYAIPSPADVRGALGRQDVQNGDDN